jgi:hypothetical protein
MREAQSALEADERVAAAWLEGSFASGDADAWSDVDLHVAVADDVWDGFFGERLALLGRIRPVLGHGEVPLPWGAHLVFATLSGPVRLDLYIERVSRLESALRMEEPRLLLDRAGAASRLKATANVDALVRMRLEELTRTLFFGSTWPVRLWGREEWGTLLFNAVAIVYQFLVPAMLIQDDARQFFRPHFHNERKLSPERRRVVDGLLGEIQSAFRTIECGELDFEALRGLHERLIGLIWRELRAACKRYGVVYPEEAEGEMREYYHRELGMDVGEPPTRTC